MFDPEYDAVTAAPAHHRVLLENEFVRVLETILEPGDTVPMHTHACAASTYIISGTDLVRRGAEGEILMDTRANGITLHPGTAGWTQPLGLHTLENVGTTPLHVITTEIKAAVTDVF